MSFTPDGSELLIGSNTGHIEVMDPLKGEYKQLTLPLKINDNHEVPCSGLVVSPDGKYFATMDLNFGVCLFKKDRMKSDPS